MKLQKNGLIAWRGDDPSARRLERILWVDPAITAVAVIAIGTLWVRRDQASDTETYVVEVGKERVLPRWRKYDEVVAALDGGDAIGVRDDPYDALKRPEEELGRDAEATALLRKRRDEAWEVIKPIVEGDKDDDGAMFDPHWRHQKILEMRQSTNRSIPTIYDDLRRYWCGGQFKNALLRRFENCGSRGTSRVKSNDVSGQEDGPAPRRGRPHNSLKQTGESGGKNITEDDLRRFRCGIKAHLDEAKLKRRRVGRNRLGVNLKWLYEQILKTEYSRQVVEDGRLKWQLPPDNTLPSYEQFRYWFQKLYNPVAIVQQLGGEGRFNRLHRPLLGDTASLAFGPGSLFQIDATLADVYLVHSIRRYRLIGRPVIYVIIDGYSRLIVGLTVTLEGPSWVGAMLALENMTTDKVVFCRRYERYDLPPITEDEWPAHHLPDALLADRAELLSRNSDVVLDNFNVRIATAAPYRADWKGIVERQFRLINDEVVQFIPGHVYPQRERGDPDYRLDATLDIHQFRAVMISFALEYNKYHRLADDRLDRAALAAGIEPYPIDLWTWGIENRSGRLRTVTQDTMRRNLLPRDEATVTGQGLNFQRLRYAGAPRVMAEWAALARIDRSWKVPIIYDPRDTNVIYRLLDGGGLEACNLLARRTTMGDGDWQETLDLFAVQGQRRQVARGRDLAASFDYDDLRSRIVAGAAAQTDPMKAGKSKRALLADTKPSRQDERDADSQEHRWSLAPVVPVVDTRLPVPSARQSLTSATDVEKFRRLREERRRTSQEGGDA